jgi:hypothetical protein
MSPAARAHPYRVRRFDILLVAVWLVAVLAGSVLLWRYKSTAGAAGAVPERWPAEATVALPRSPTLPTLVLFAHPKCPCSRASIGELSVIVSKALGRVDAHVLFDRPSSESEDWTDTDLWRSAAAIPGVSVGVDVDGVEARRFGAETSGWVVLYDPGGRLLFAGGITNARGHAGDSEGRRAVLALLGQGRATRSRAPVFGCSLSNPELAREAEAEGREATWTRAQ